MDTTATTSQVSQQLFEMARQLALSEPREIYDLWRLSDKELDSESPLSEYCADATRHLIRYQRMILTDERRKAFDEILNIARQTSVRSVTNGQLVGNCGMDILIAAREAMQTIFRKYFDSSLIVYDMVSGPIRLKVEDQLPNASFTEIGLDTGPLNRVYEIIKFALLQHFGEPVDEILKSRIKGNCKHDPAYRLFETALCRKISKNLPTGRRSPPEKNNRRTSPRNNNEPTSANYLNGIYFTKDFQGDEMIRNIRDQIHARLGGLNFEKLLGELHHDFSMVRKELNLNIVPRGRRDSSTPVLLLLARRDNCVQIPTNSEGLSPGKPRKGVRRGRKLQDASGDKRAAEMWETDRYPTYHELATVLGESEKATRNRIRRYKQRARYVAGK